MKYFLRAATSSGEVSFTGSEISKVGRVYLLDGASKTVKTRIMNAVGTYFEGVGKCAEYIVSPMMTEFYDAMIVREADFAVADASVYPHDGILIKSDVSPHGISDREKECESLKNEMYSVLFAEYAYAKKIHDEWEKIYIKNMDFEALNRFADEEIKLMVRERGKEGEGALSERFFGASVPSGAVNYIEPLTKGIAERYFIKGRPGTGKSTFLKKLLRRATSMGYDAEVYYCSFDKDSLDMVIVRELSLAVFDSTAPHELFPTEKRDTVLDFYKAAHLEGVDERYEKELSEVSRRYAFHTGKGRAALLLAQFCEKEKERGSLSDEAMKNAVTVAERIISENM